jgi:hypothetical protein
MGDIFGLEPSFYEALGRFTATWAYLELGVDGACVSIFHRFGGKTISPNIPYSLDKKIEYLRKALKKLPDLSPFSERCATAVEILASLRTDRHDFIHGLHGSLNSKGEPISGRVRYVPDNLFMQQRRCITPKEIDKATRRTLDAALLFISLVVDLNDLSSQPLADKTSSK